MGGRSGAFDQAQDLFNLQVEDVAWVGQPAQFVKSAAQLYKNQAGPAKKAGTLKAQIFPITDQLAGILQDPVEQPVAEGACPQRGMNLGLRLVSGGGG